MEALGINWVYLILQIFFVVVWPLLSLTALYVLRRKHLIGINQALWALLIVAIPVLGALTFFIVKPGDSDHSSNARKAD
jgi:hypothetical protein